MEIKETPTEIEITTKDMEKTEESKELQFASALIWKTRQTMKEIALAKEIDEKHHSHEYFTLMVKEPYYDELTGVQLCSDRPTQYYERTMTRHTVRFLPKLATLISVKFLERRDEYCEIIIDDENIQNFLQKIIDYQKSNPMCYMEKLPFERFSQDLLKLECLSEPFKKNKLRKLLFEVNKCISYDGYIKHVNEWSVTRLKFFHTAALAFCLNSPMYLGKAEYQFQELWTRTKHTQKSFVQVYATMLKEQFVWPRELTKYGIISILSNENTSLFELLIHSGCTSLNWKGECDGYSQDLIRFISNCNTLTSVTFSKAPWERCYWNKEILLMVIHAIGQSKTITSTSIPNYFFGNEEDLCDALKELQDLKQLETLSIAPFIITEKISEKLVDFINSHPKLYEMYFHQEYLNKETRDKINGLLKSRMKS